MWKQAKGKIQEKWDKLTEDDLKFIDGRRDRLEGRIQQRYGFSPDHVRKEVDDWGALASTGEVAAPEPNCEIKFGAGDDHSCDTSAAILIIPQSIARLVADRQAGS